ncbi:MAG: hypothetical protein FWB71_04920 [Defluviitaleaceae bacterium]|nr:hypothetical protein [Defluviitaleaceae bacterium]
MPRRGVGAAIRMASGSTVIFAPIWARGWVMGARLVWFMFSKRTRPPVMAAAARYVPATILSDIS